MRRETFSLVAPYVAWMVLMMALPATDAAYALRTVVSWGILSFTIWDFWSSPEKAIGSRSIPAAFGWGIGIGLLVLFVWVWPERFGWYREWCIIGNPASEPRAIDKLLWMRVFGSAFVIAPAEELFFRSFLYRWLQHCEWEKADLRKFEWSAFIWMVVLFAVEHNRFVVGAFAGAAYGLLAIRKGLFAAIIAHVVTNLALALYIIKTGSWAFW